LRLLLDTHPFIWSLLEPDRLPERLRATLVDPAHIVYVSAASVWEIAIKHGLGKLSLPPDTLETDTAESGFESLAITATHAVAVSQLPLLHRDPFDRLLIAQARHERLTLVTRDPAVRRYQVDTLWD
jgi:PIN domain nuclease of toxin-antitoxin system